MKNHLWENGKSAMTTCKRCGITRERRTSRIIMAIMHGRDYCKYENEYYFGNGSSEGFKNKRPPCEVKL